MSGCAREIKGLSPDLLPRKSDWEAHGKQTVRTVHARARMSLRRFPPRPGQSRNWTCFVVRDHNGQALAYVYFVEEEPGRRSAARLLTRDEPLRHQYQRP